MIPGLDSSYSEPTDPELEAAKAGGIRLWAGYMATKPGVRLAHPWPKAVFDRVRSHGLATLAYVSGYDDPGAIRRQAASWGIKTGLDVEGGGLRPDGPWVQEFLDISASGLYGNAGVHPGRSAAFHIYAGYFGYDPKITWPLNLPRPAGPLGWQWLGGHPQFGADVDSTWFDDWFLGSQGDDMQAYFVVPDAGPSTGTVFLVQNIQMGPKRRVFNPAEWTAYAATMTDTKVYTIPQFVLDQMPAEDSAKLDGISSQIAALPAGGGGGPKTVTSTVTSTLT